MVHSRDLPHVESALRSLTHSTQQFNRESPPRCCGPTGSAHKSQTRSRTAVDDPEREPRWALPSWRRRRGWQCGLLFMPEIRPVLYLWERIWYNTLAPEPPTVAPYIGEPPRAGSPPPLGWNKERRIPQALLPPEPHCPPSPRHWVWLTAALFKQLPQRPAARQYVASANAHQSRKAGCVPRLVVRPILLA